MKLALKQQNKQQGFTLIELVIVIVILGILAATAAPKFIDLQDDAKEAALEAVHGSMESVISLVNAKAIIAGQDGAIGKVTIDGDTYALINGFPTGAEISGTANTDGDGDGILGLLDLDSDFSGTENITLQVSFNGCSITYTNSTGTGARPVISDPTCP
jgi:MSHA pilin protein MshA